MPFAKASPIEAEDSQAKINILSPDFNANKLTKLQIRSLLGEHGMAELPPMSVKKDELIQLLHSTVIEPALKKAALAKGKAAVKPSTHGITFLDGSGRVGSPLPPKSFASEAVQVDSPKVRGRKKTSEPKGREESDVFSDENPFQTPIPVRTRSLSRKPKRESTVQESPISTSKAGKLEKANLPPKNSTKAKSSPKVPSKADSPLKAAAKVQAKVSSPATPLPFPEKIILEPYVERQDKVLKFFSLLSNFVRFLIKAVVVVAIAAYAYIYFARPFPYCSSEGAATERSISFSSFKDFADSLSTYCIPCPANAKCIQGQLKCNDKYIEKRGILSISSTCVLDKGKLSALEDMLSTAKKILNARLGEAQCGKLSSQESEALTGAQLKQILASTTSKSRIWNSSPAKFDEFWRLFVEEIKRASTSYGIIYREGKLSGMEPAFSLECRARSLCKSVGQKYKVHLALFLLALAVYWKCSRLLSRKKSIARLADQMIQQVFAKLQLQHQQANRDHQQFSMQTTPPPTLSINQLRDTLMIGAGNSTLSLDQSTKKAIWDNVYKIVSSNSNVREYVSTIRGEQHKVWEWIGIAAGQMEEMQQVRK